MHLSSKSLLRYLLESEPAQLVGWIVWVVVTLSGIGLFTFTDADKAGLTTILLAIVPIVQGVVTRELVFAPANVLVAQRKPNDSNYFEVVPGPATVPADVTDAAVLAAAYDDGTYLNDERADEYEPLSTVPDDELDGSELDVRRGDEVVKRTVASNVPIDEVNAVDPNAGIDEDTDQTGRF